MTAMSQEKLKDQGKTSFDNQLTGGQKQIGRAGVADAELMGQMGQKPAKLRTAITIRSDTQSEVRNHQNTTPCSNMPHLRTTITIRCCLRKLGALYTDESAILLRPEPHTYKENSPEHCLEASFTTTILEAHFTAINISCG